MLVWTPGQVNMGVASVWFHFCFQLLSDEAPKASEGDTGNARPPARRPSGETLYLRCHGDTRRLPAGKQLVQYTATPVQVPEAVSLEDGVADLPSLLELEAGPFFGSDTPADDPPDVLLNHTQLDSNLWHDQDCEDQRQQQ